MAVKLGNKSLGGLKVLLPQCTHSTSTVGICLATNYIDFRNTLLPLRHMPAVEMVWKTDCHYYIHKENRMGGFLRQNRRKDVRVY